MVNNINGICIFIEMIHIQEDPFVLFERVNINELIKGVRYYIKDYIKNEKYTEIYATLVHYLEGERTPHALFTSHAYYSFYQDLLPTIIHRRISKKEYYAKVKEKYDHKCLNIILKRLVDESFEW